MYKNLSMKEELCSKQRNYYNLQNTKKMVVQLTKELYQPLKYCASNKDLQQPMQNLLKPPKKLQSEVKSKKNPETTLNEEKGGTIDRCKKEKTLVSNLKSNFNEKKAVPLKTTVQISSQATRDHICTGFNSHFIKK
jgi:predicted transcriptional regulator